MKTKTEGFTLLEIMVSLAIAGGLLVTLLYTINFHLGIAQRHGTLTAAVSLARGKLLEMEKNPSASKGSFPNPYADYLYETTVQEASFPLAAEIGVTVTHGSEIITLKELIIKKNGKF
jgi:general secretion pathway protein I